MEALRLSRKRERIERLRRPEAFEMACCPLSCSCSGFDNIFSSKYCPGCCKKPVCPPACLHPLPLPLCDFRLFHLWRGPFGDRSGSKALGSFNCSSHVKMSPISPHPGKAECHRAGGKDKPLRQKPPNLETAEHLHGRN